MEITSSFGRVVLASLGLFATAASAFASGTHYYVNDHLATTVGIADAAGEIAALEADAFGSPIAAGTNPGRYTGKPYDEDMGTYVFPFRNYRAEEARWMSADPSGFPDGANNHSYVFNPLLGLDPWGLAETYYREVHTEIKWYVEVGYKTSGGWSGLSATASTASATPKFSASSTFLWQTIPADIAVNHAGTATLRDDGTPSGDGWVHDSFSRISNTVTTSHIGTFAATINGTHYHNSQFYVVFQVDKIKEKYTRE